jgi:hypothetical protein
MKQMTTAEFKAELTEIAEPVAVRRYSQVIGAYYPQGFEPSAPPPPAPEPVPGPETPQISFNTEPKLLAKVVDLEMEVKRLKRELAARPPALTDAVSRTEVPAVTVNPYRPRSTSENPFADLPKQDREFFERKLGGKKGK